METTLETKPMEYFDLKYKMYVPLDTARYGVPSLKHDQTWPEQGNQLVSYISGSVQRQRAGDAGPGSIDDIFRDRMGLIRSKVELILLLLSQRKEISQEVLNQIDADSCYVQNLIFAMGPKKYQMDRDRIFLERMKFDLERQRRLEQVSYFRDTGLLNRDLKDTLIDYLGEVHKSSFVGDMEDEK